MTSCIPCVGNIKHATLIKNCYPPLKEGGTIPRSSELSYLTFYASSRPAKLTKVGSFIQKKVEKDIRKGRKGNNLVSLQIIKALIQTCHRDLNIFSKYVVKILSLLLDTRDLEIIDLCCETFIVFCSYHDGTTLGVDEQFTTEYEILLEKFAGFCNYSNQDPALSLKMQYIGHRAIQANVTSSALQSSNFKKQLGIIFTPLIITLASSKQALDTSNGTIDIRISALNNHQINRQLIESIAAHTISLLFSKLTGPTVRLSLVPLFGYLNDKDQWWPPHLAVNIMRLVLDSLQPQYRYLLISEILHHLDLVNKDDSMINDKNAALVSILDTILNANMPLVGVSVLEVLNSLFTLLMKTMSFHTFNPSAQLPANHDEKTDYATTIQHGLVHCIGGLATQIYYDNQLNDMIGYLISKLRTSTSLEYVDDILIHDYRVIVLCCVDSVVQGSKHVISPDSSQAEIRISGPKLPMEAWNPALGLLYDKNPKTRLVFTKSLYGFLQNLPPKITVNPANKYPEHLLHHADVTFVNRLVLSMLDWVIIPDFNLTDLRFFYAFMCILNRKFGIDATTMIVPLVFKVQHLIQQDDITLHTRQYAIESALISWFIMTAEFYHIEPLLKYIQTIKTSQGTLADDITWTESIDNSVLHAEQPELFTIHKEDSETKANCVWIDRSIVVELMSKEGNLRDETDTHGLELEAKLFAEWGSEAFLKHDQLVRTRIVQDSNGVKPRLASPWEHADMERPPLSLQDKKDGIRVATLKEALVAQQALPDDDGLETDSTQSNSLSAHSKPPVMRTNTEMNAFLTELNIPQQVAASTVSLVNPPYKSS